MVARLYLASHAAAIALLADLDSGRANSYLQLIPINRFPAAHSCARRFFAWQGD
jgi:hypothetical protein